MATNKVKIIGPKSEQVKHTHRDNWEVMKPFVHFAFGAMKVIATGLIGIVKAALPLLKPHDNKSTSVKRRV
ncbi:MAG TPA: hypothetical protein VK668_07725 [Mucilaginibacter sp.]|nr:hypothetical protein [Mucilaginibacter sp.]